MTRAAHIASQDTPQAVTVPASLSGLMTYAVAKLGMGALFAWGCWFLADSREQLHQRYETQLSAQVVQQQAQITAMETMVRTMSAALEIASKGPK